MLIEKEKLMHRKQIVTLGLVGIVAITALIGASAYSSVQASAPDQATTPTPSTPASPKANPKAGAPNTAGPQRELKGGTSDQDLATALGITLEKLQAATTTATDEALKQAVAEGLITQAQADQIKARGGRFEGLGRFATGSTSDYDALLAKALGISVDQLKAGYLKAFNTRIDAAVAAGTLTQAQADLQKGQYALQNNSKYQSALQSAYEAAVKQAVSDGVITQAQADAILAQKAGFGRGMMMGGFGDMRGGKGGHGMPGGPNQTLPDGSTGRGQRGGNGAAPTATPGTNS
jgi:hypothetical protein